MREPKLHFEQIPVEIAKKILAMEKLRSEVAKKKQTVDESAIWETPDRNIQNCVPIPTHLGERSAKMASSVAIADDGDHLDYPDWQRSVQAALVEFKKDKLLALVGEAEVAIFNRLQAISQSSDHEAERQALEDALSNLRVLKRESLGFPDWEKK
jgi:hypothetical protein